MTSTKKSCRNCSENFEITQEDKNFYDKISPVFSGKKYQIPEPSLCPDCRQQRRLSFRNFVNLYNRECDLTGKKIISCYDTEINFPVYEQHEWWGDKWDQFQYGKEFDFSRSFFKQFQELYVKTPKMSVHNAQCENSDYCNFSYNSKNCYLVFGNINNEDCQFGHIVWKSENCYDCVYTYQSELCYESTDTVNCYDVSFSQNVENCRNSHFLINCKNCVNCFGCTGLVNAKYYIFNKKYSQEKYEEMLQQFNKGDFSLVETAKKRVNNLLSHDIVKNYHGLHNENISGDYIYFCKNTQKSYDTKNCEDSKFLVTVESFIDCYDCSFSPQKTEISYEGIFISGYSILFSHNAIDCSNVIYSDNCFYCKNCFGCSSLKNAQYCIFNKQYTKEEYEKLVPKIIEHMQKTGEWGEFFPSEISPFAYNETVAQEYFPLTKKEVVEKGLNWKEEKKSQEYLGPKVEIPDDISDVTDEICSKILQCEVTEKLYKITPQELQFYRKMNIPIPRKCPDQRHKERMALRNPRKLFERKCDNCSVKISTTYAPERPEKVFCEKCYLESVY